MSEPTFVCKDCGAAVYDALGQTRERCYPCQWVANIVDEVERAEVRAWLIEVGVIESLPAVLGAAHQTRRSTSPRLKLSRAVERKADERGPGRD